MFENNKNKDEKSGKEKEEPDFFSHLIGNILGIAIAIAAAGWLLQLAACYFWQAFPTLCVVAIIVAAVVIGYRVWKNRTRW